jgi:hypothetical protein
MTKALIEEIGPGKPAIITGLSPWSQKLGALFWGQRKQCCQSLEQRIGFASREAVSICFSSKYPFERPT